MNFHVLTLFPDMVKDGLYTSILKRASDNGLINIHAVNIRDYTTDKHKKTDDYPFGGGAGLLMQAEPVFRAHEAVLSEIQNGGQKKVRTIYLSPQGQTFNQRMAEELAREEDLVFLCGHYEGIDERVLTEVVTDTVSIGDFVLTGGELAAMMMIDAIARLVPGVLHNSLSAGEESFSGYLLEYPQYTRPEIWRGKKVPEALLTGDHKKIRQWRMKEAEERTRTRRPDLYEQYLALMDCKTVLLLNKLLHRDMIECIDRGFATLVYREGETVLLYNRAGNVYLLTAKDEASGKKALSAIKEEPEAIVTRQEFMNSIVQDFQFVPGQTNRLSMCGPCVQMVYTRKEPLPAPKARIEILTEEYTELIAANYELLSKEEIRRHLKDGSLYGIFSEQELAGFCGEHAEGSMGMLFIFPQYRKMGYASQIESFLINATIQKGYTPYCQIFSDNEASIMLQKKLCLYSAKGNIRWFVRK